MIFLRTCYSYYSFEAVIVVGKSETGRSVALQRFHTLRKTLAEPLQKHRSGTLIFISAIILTLVTSIHYIVVMLDWTSPGFSLDDSWIHLQFARTVYQGTPWEYSPGEPSTGSTSPLWAILLSSLFFFTQDQIGLVWGTIAISIALYILGSFLVGLIVSEYTGSSAFGIIGIIGYVLVPRNTWLMLSGMETPLFMFLLLLGILVLDKHEIKYDIIFGVIAGLAFLARPEGGLLILVGLPVRILILLKKRELDVKRVGSSILAGSVALLIVLPWLMHCHSVTGFLLPDTFYAKVHVPSAEEIEAWNFWWNFWIRKFPYIIIGLLVGLVLSYKQKPYPWLFAIALTILYRLSLPYTSLLNNARWLVPVFDFLVITSIAGTLLVITRLFMRQKQPDIVMAKFIAVTIVASLILIPMIPQYIAQADLYGNSVKNINEQQVDVALWLRRHTPSDAVIAVTDAGAMRFLSERAIIDLSHLMNPDINHRDMTIQETLVYMRNHSCEYLALHDAFISAYVAYLAGGLSRVYRVKLYDNVISVGPVLCVYKINWTRVSLL